MLCLNRFFLGGTIWGVIAKQ